MRNTSLALALLALSLSASPAPQTRGQSSLPSVACPNPLPREPLVLYEVTGGTLSGSVDYFLSVHGDGSARLSSYLGDGTGSSQYTGMDPLVAEALRADLAAAGAFAQCDAPDITSDTPLQTLTVFRAESRRAHTFSWFTSDGELADIQAILDAFIAAHFAPPPGGGGSGS